MAISFRPYDGSAGTNVTTACTDRPPPLSRAVFVIVGGTPTPSLFHERSTRPGAGGSVGGLLPGARRADGPPRVRGTRRVSVGAGVRRRRPGARRGFRRGRGNPRAARHGRFHE